eukprot:CAMPEP_0115289260 /NCGR_PEP_ID=MMETSP0270-20121206/63413_1 /TAXON_ID=71861 /ORGANISM="Scrippsiella trochoidea, Strain CCMP3099" /LENGTH=45 /DNA_ID= /DNA_START= /DNA_END= /DNA_ORIENTATION=
MNLFMPLLKPPHMSQAGQLSTSGMSMQDHWQAPSSNRAPLAKAHI